MKHFFLVCMVFVGALALTSCDLSFLYGEYPSSGTTSGGTTSGSTSATGIPGTWNYSGAQPGSNTGNTSNITYTLNSAGNTIYNVQKDSSGTIVGTSTLVYTLASTISSTSTTWDVVMKQDSFTATGVSVSSTANLNKYFHVTYSLDSTGNTLTVTSSTNFYATIAEATVAAVTSTKIFTRQ